MTQSHDVVPDSERRPRDPEDRPVTPDDEERQREKMHDKTLADSFPTSDPLRQFLTRPRTNRQRERRL